MLGNSSFSLQGATPNSISSALGFNPNDNYGIKKSTPAPTPVQQPAPQQSPVQQVQQGSNPGMIKSTTAPSGVVTNYDTKPNPSVLEQQKSLNKLGAGLVEDGIIGPKTRDAISQYSGQLYNTSSAPTTPTNTPDYPPQSNPAPLQDKTPQGAQPPSLTVSGLIPGVQKASEMTDWEKDLREGSAVKDANEALKDFRIKQSQAFGDIENQAIPLVFQQGRKQILQRQAAEQESALQSGVTNALANQGQQLTAAQAQAQRGLSGATTALGAVAPQFPSYGSQIVQPGLLGTESGQNSGLQQAVSGVIQKLTNGQMSYNDALTALEGYGQGGVNALQQSLPSNFNIAQSNTLAGQQGSVGVNYQLAETALNNVENIINELAGPQKTNVPAINTVANWISTQFGVGSEQTRAMTGAVQSLRNAYASLLASVKGGTPTDYSNQAMSEIPSEPTPNDIAAVRKNFETLGQARKDILGNPGQSTSGSTSGGSFGWDALN